MIPQIYLFVVCVVSLICGVEAGDKDCSAGRDLGHACENGKEGRFFYYDSRMKVCQPFTYLGCAGNNNKFKTAAECRSVCKNLQADVPQLKIGHAQWTQAEKCGSTHLIPNGKYIDCKKSKKNNCPANHKCKNKVCCPTKEYVCSLQDDTGTFADGIEDKPRFAWNNETQSCTRFSYYGAAGNYNNFASFRKCINYCGPKDS